MARGLSQCCKGHIVPSSKLVKLAYDNGLSLQSSLQSILRMLDGAVPTRVRAESGCFLLAG